FEGLNGGTDLSLSQDEGVVDEAIETLGFSGAVTAHARHACALRRYMLENVADYIRILARCVGVNFFIAVWVRTNQLDLAVETTGNPVVVNLIALSPAFNVFAAVLIVQVAILHAKHRSRMREFIGSHV